jgi:hypothetical protein
VPSDGLEEIHRLHEHAEAGFEKMDPKAAALLRSDPDGTDDPAPAKAPRTSRARKSRAKPKSAPEAPAESKTLLPAEQAG